VASSFFADLFAYPKLWHAKLLQTLSLQVVVKWPKTRICEYLENGFFNATHEPEQAMFKPQAMLFTVSFAT
jgi:hypothetical protein